jgi:YVTN family beta-propeller protein
VRAEALRRPFRSPAARRLRALTITVAGFGLLAGMTTASTWTASAATLRDVVLIGNSANGTVSFLDGHTFQNLGSMSVTGDAAKVISGMNPVERIGYESTKSIEGGIRYVDDVFASPDGRRLYVSRGELMDAVAYDIATKKQIWRTKLEGFKTDHAVLSPDGTTFIVSATTAGKAFVLDTATGAVRTSFATGTYPHANDYSPDGRFLYNSSIGITSLPKVLNGLKGNKQVTVVDPTTFRVLRTLKFEYGVRPAVFTRDNRFMYVQFSYLNGFAEVDLSTGAITKTVKMPFSTSAAALALDSYPQNSAHHGMAITPSENALCDVGTIDDYTAIIARPSLSPRSYVNYPTGSIPYWATTSADGTKCLVTLSGRDEVSVVDYATGAETARIPVGDFPQRERLAAVPQAVLDTLNVAKG